MSDESRYAIGGAMSSAVAAYIRRALSSPSFFAALDTEPAARVADNPHKPGTPEHRTWEHTHVHNRRYPGSTAWEEAKETADLRLTTLKAHHGPQDPKAAAVAAVLREVEEATKTPTARFTLSPSAMKVFINGVDLGGYIKSVSFKRDTDDPLPPPNYTITVPRTLFRFIDITGV